MKITDLRKKSKEDLTDLLKERQRRRDELGELLREKKAKNVKELHEVKKDIARILTVLGGQ